MAPSSAAKKTSKTRSATLPKGFALKPLFPNSSEPIPSKTASKSPPKAKPPSPKSNVKSKTTTSNKAKPAVHCECIAISDDEDIVVAPTAGPSRLPNAPTMTVKPIQISDEIEEIEELEEDESMMQFAKRTTVLPDDEDWGDETPFSKYQDVEDEEGIDNDDDDELKWVEGDPEDSMEKPNHKRGRSDSASSVRSILPRTLSCTPAPEVDVKGKGKAVNLPNAFTALMQSNNNNKLWKQAEISEKAKAVKGVQRPAPFYKILEGMKIAVDAFKYGKIPNVNAYFLTHAHSDHYTNLSQYWKHGPIYCSIGTANLIKLKLGVKDEWLHPMPYDTPIEVDGVTVTAIDANHCPGSAIFVFEGKHSQASSPYTNTKRVFRYLHCGDFRASPAHLNHPTLKNKKVDICYLDTTYLNPKYCFPSQQQVIDACAELVAKRCGGDKDALNSGGAGEAVKQEGLMKDWLATAPKKEEPSTKSEPLDDSKPKKADEKLLVLCGTYSIGKERIVKAIAKAIGSKIYADARKTQIFLAQADPDLASMLTDDPLAAQVHVTWLGQIKQDLLREYLLKYKPHFNAIIGLRPTGWTYKPDKGQNYQTLPIQKILQRELKRQYSAAWMYPTKDSTPTVQAYGVPYSEHSSFAELTCFALALDCARMIATVNIHTAASRAKMNAWFDKWRGEKKRRREAGEPDFFHSQDFESWRQVSRCYGG